MDKIKQAKEQIPQVDNNLKAKIYQRYENERVLKRKKVFRFTTIGALSTIAIISAIAIPAFIGGKAKGADNKYSKEYAETYDDKTHEIPGSRTDEYSAAPAISSTETEEYDAEKVPFDEKVNQGNGKHGLLSSCAYNDNEHYNFFKTLCNNQESEFNDYYQQFATSMEISPMHRIKVNVPNNVCAKCELYLDDCSLAYSAFSDKTGTAYLFTKKAENITLKLSYIDSYGNPNYLKDDYSLDYLTENDFTLNYQQSTELLNATSNFDNKIELMFVIDTTGSMSDELVYINNEIENVISRVKKQNKDVSILTSALFYRDFEDEYLTKFSGFSYDVADTKSFISIGNASGGGDFPEAIQEAYKKVINAQWSDSNSTKIVVHIADAPSHDEDVASWFNSINMLANKGIRVISVASSGIDKKTEYLFRCQSMFTNGTYTYLTDDSGIGETHEVPTTEDNPVVEYLNDMLVRLICEYHTGIKQEIIPYYKSNQEQQ